MPRSRCLVRPRALRTSAMCAALTVLPSAALLPAAVAAQAPVPPAAPAAGAPEALRTAPSAATPTAFVGVTVVPLERGATAARTLAAQTVVVRDGRIVAVGPAARVAVPAGAVRVEGRGKFLMPGLVDMHAHLAPGGESLAEPAGRQLALYLATGVTTVRGLGGPPSALALRDRVRRGEVLGPALYVAAPSLNGQSVASAADGAARVRAAKQAGYDLLKTHGMFASAAVYDSIAAAAAAAGLPLVGHVTPEVGLERAMRAGQQIEHFDGYVAAMLADGVPAPPGQLLADAALLAQVDTAKMTALAARTARAGVWNGPTIGFFKLLVSEEPTAAVAARPEMRYVHPKALAQAAAQREQLRQEFPADGRRAFIAVRDALLRAMHRAGAKLLVGSDSPQTFMAPGFGTLLEIEAFVEAGLPPAAALAAATRDPAEWLGRNDIGSVAVGKRADLVLLDGDPFADVRTLRRPAGVMVGGRWLDRGRLDALLEAVAAQYAAAPPAP